MVQSLRQQLESGPCRLSLVPVTLVAPSTPTWRRLDWEANTRSAPTEENEPDLGSLSVPSELGNLPIEVGGLIQFPFCSGSFRLNGDVFRVVLAGGTESDGESSSLIFFARDLSTRFISRDDKGGTSSEHGAHSEICPLPCDHHRLVALPNVSLLRDQTLHHMARVLSNSGALLCGPRGSGRSHSAVVVAAYASVNRGYSTVYLDCKKLRDSRQAGMKDILSELTQLFKDASEKLPCSVVLDNLDELIPSSESGSPLDDSAKSQQINPAGYEQSKLIGDTFCHLLNVTRSKGRVLVVASCLEPQAISDSVIASASLGSPIVIPPWSSTERESLFSRYLQRSNDTKLFKFASGFGNSTEGYRPRDIEQLSLRVCERARQIRNKEESLDGILSGELSTFVPLSRASASVELFSRSSPSWSDIGGLFQAKEQLTATIIKPSMYRRIYENSQVRLPRGVLLYGPGGCGKTYLVSALAKKCGYRLVTCRGAELLDKYIGASEANVRELFARATSVAPSILFLDELDALAPRRGSDNTGVTDRCVNQLLTFLDGVEDVSRRDQVYILAASSRPDKIDPALLRPGRLERHIYVGHSETKEEATDLLSKIAGTYDVLEEVLDWILSGLLADSLCDQDCFRTCMSAADMKGAFNTAQVNAVHEALSNNSTDKVQICRRHLEEAFRCTQPSLSADEYCRLESIYAPFKGTPASLERREPLRLAQR